MSAFGTNTSTIGIARQPKRPTTKRGETTGKQPLWIPMLQSASRGKDLPEKHLVVLGATSEQQHTFLEHLNPKESQRRRDRRQGAAANDTPTIPISNKYALGYTYHDILDADHEDVLARLNVHMLTNPSGRFVPLLKPLFSAKTVQDTLVLVLLDWSEPFKWSRQLRQWIRLLRRVILSLNEETKVELEECMNNWKRKVGPDAQNLSIQEQNVVNLGPGEWDEGLGFPLAVACVQSEKIQDLEREHGWGDDQFDFLQQWLRTVLLKHGASLIYTATGDANNVRPLVHSSLSIQSLLKKEVLKHNVIDRDKIFVPPNWDSWGKIRILREGYDPEAVSTAWSIEIQSEPEETPNFTPISITDIQAIIDESQAPTSAVTIFESSLPNPTSTSTIPEPSDSSSTKITIVATPLQEFLQAQKPILDKLQAEDEEEDRRILSKPNISTINSNEKDSFDTNTTTTVTTPRSTSPLKNLSHRMAEHIGPHTINVNGIDLDAEEATRRLRERETERVTAAAATSSNTTSHTTGRNTGGMSTPTMSRTRSALTGNGESTTPGADGKEKPSNEALHGFFANLIKKGQQGATGSRGSGSGANSPGPGGRRESPAPSGERRLE